MCMLQNSLKCQVLYGKTCKTWVWQLHEDCDMLLIVKSGLICWELELYALTLQYLYGTFFVDSKADRRL